MSPSELHRAVARATGESIRQVKRLGFSLLRPPHRCRRPKPPAGPMTLSLSTACIETMSAPPRAAA